ncbi:MAG: HAD family hydrolase [Puniceicoccales bacterium]|jgi:phosphoglycolate phosphatase|nr:HAD family hydrolase [Puniceicoccales bacterium]
MSLDGKAPASIQTVLFDLDGTLVDNFQAIHRAYSDVAQMLGLPRMTYQDVMNAVGGSIAVTIRRLIGEAQAEDAVRLYHEHFPSVMYEGLRTYDGVVELLGELKKRGLKLAVYTNKDADASRKILDYLKLTDWFDGIFGTNDVPWRKPDPHFTHYVLGKLNATADRTIMVGDSPFDVATARNGKLAAVYCVTTGSHNATQLAEHSPDGIFPGFAELGECVFGIK